MTANTEGASSAAPASAPYASANEHLEDELGLVGMMIDRAIARGRREGWLDGDDAATVDDPAVVEAFSRIEARLATTATCEAGPLPMDLLRRRFELSLPAQRVLWLLIGFELDPRVRKLLCYLSLEDSTAVTLGTIHRVVYQPDLSAAMLMAELGPDSPLVRWRLIEHCDPAPGRVPLAARRIRVNDRVLELAGGLTRLDPEVAALATSSQGGRAFDQLVIPDRVREELERLFEAGAFGASRAVPVLVGPQGAGRRSALHAAASAAGAPVLGVACRALPADAREFVRAIRAIGREAALMGAVLLLEELHELRPDREREQADRLEMIDKELIDHIDGIVAATSVADGQPWRLARGAVVIELEAPDEQARRELWRRAAGDVLPEDSIAAVAARYPVTGGVIVDAAAALRALEVDGSPEDRVHRALRSALDTRIAGLGSRCSTHERWADLVLPEDTMAEVREMVARVRHRQQVFERWGFGRRAGRGRGLSALFSGPPGTGKTMVAGLIAEELGLDLYQVDLSRVVSKWVGETEKNLASLFAAAESGHAVLLFDEADALFAKRTDVKSSMDRYANLEVNYLLQRMEAFAGITVLTTNHDEAIDDAFRRRLSFRIAFPIPDEEERERLWRTMIPLEAELDDDVDYTALAEAYELTGGYIRNVVLRAAFFAADDGSAISMQHFRRAAALELAAMGKVVAHGR